MSHADLDLTLRAAGDSYAADISLRAPDSTAGAGLAQSVPVALGLPMLTERAGHGAAYGADLTATAQLFAAQPLRADWASARPLPGRQHSPAAPPASRPPPPPSTPCTAELLHDPLSGVSLGCSERAHCGTPLTNHLSP